MAKTSLRLQADTWRKGGLVEGELLHVLHALRMWSRAWGSQELGTEASTPAAPDPMILACLLL